MSRALSREQCRRFSAVDSLRRVSGGLRVSPHIAAVERQQAGRDREKRIASRCRASECGRASEDCPGTSNDRRPKTGRDRHHGASRGRVESHEGGRVPSRSKASIVRLRRCAEHSDFRASGRGEIGGSHDLSAGADCGKLGLSSSLTSKQIHAGYHARGERGRTAYTRFEMRTLLAITESLLDKGSF